MSLGRKIWGRVNIYFIYYLYLFKNIILNIPLLKPYTSL